MVKYDLGWSANEGRTRIDVLITEWRKASCCNRFSIYMIEVMDGDSALEVFEFKVALLSRHLTCWSPATPPLVPTCWGVVFPLVELVKLDKPQPLRAGSQAMASGLAPALAGSCAHVLVFIASHSVGTRHSQGMAGDRAVAVWLWPALETLFQSLPSSWLASCNGLGF